MSGVPHRPRRVALFVTCMVDTLYPGVGLAAARLLERHGVEVSFPERQTCCGQPAFNTGDRREALVMARHFLDVFWPLLSGGRVEAVVAPGGSCVAMVTHYYEVLCSDAEDAPLLERAQLVRDHTFELSQYLVDVLGVREADAHFDGRLTYHPCCHLLRELRVDTQPRQLLEGVRGADLVDLPGAEECCGFGGLFAIKNAEISTAMARRKAAHLASTGADVVAVCDVSCMTHLNGLLRRQGARCRAVHIAELLTGAAADRAR